MTEPEIITSVEPDARGGGAVRICVNHRAFCTIPASSVRELSLCPGQFLDEQLRVRLSQAADAHAAYRSVLAALGRRAFARRDLERRLVHRGHPRDAVRTALDRARAAGLLDDQAFAVTYVELKSARGRGPARLLRDLFAMGVDRGIAEAAVAAVWSEEDAVMVASRALAQKRAAQLGNVPLPVKRRRLLAYLARRGFTGREVRAIVRSIVAEPASRQGMQFSHAPGGVS